MSEPPKATTITQDQHHVTRMSRNIATTAHPTCIPSFLHITNTSIIILLQACVSYHHLHHVSRNTSHNRTITQESINKQSIKQDITLPHKDSTSLQPHDHADTNPLAYSTQIKTLDQRFEHTP